MHAVSPIPANSEGLEVSLPLGKEQGLPRLPHPHNCLLIIRTYLTFRKLLFSYQKRGDNKSCYDKGDPAIKEMLEKIVTIIVKFLLFPQSLLKLSSYIIEAKHCSLECSGNREFSLNKFSAQYKSFRGPIFISGHGVENNSRSW